MDFTPENNECYNEPFSYDELLKSLDKSHDTAVGPDQIHYQIIKHLPKPTKECLLHIFNTIWESGNFPPSWSQATIIPIPKPGKDHSDPNNYRPIALTSCVCKTMERMINERLIWFLETNNVITDIQCGFRKNRSTVDQLVRLETYIRDAFVNKEHVVSIFFDLEKAYDTTWKYGILKDLHNIGLKGHLPNFIKNFLSNRNFNVRVGSTLSDNFEQEMGVPQGSILSVTLFSIKINSLAEVLKNEFHGSLYVDDFTLCYKSKNMNSIERKLQLCLNKIQNWADVNGFKFSKTKTACVHFCSKRKHDDPKLQLDGNPIKVVKEFKYLGVIFDNKLSFIPHIAMLKEKCFKALDIIKVVANTKWGADKNTLLHLYRSLIRSKLDYGCIVYGAARTSYVKALDAVHHQGLRLCTGAFRTSPSQSLYVEANEPPLDLRRIKLLLQYIVKLKANSNNPAFRCVFHPQFEELYDKNKNCIKAIGLRAKKHLLESNIPLGVVQPSTLSEIPPWKLLKPNVDTSLSEYKKSETNSVIFKQKLSEIKQSQKSKIDIYTDGSKDQNRVAAAAVIKNEIFSARLPNETTIFTAEAKAIQLAFDFIKTSNEKRFTIFSDSLSCLQSIKNMNIDHPYILDILQQYTILTEQSKHVEFCWIPSHIGIHGNAKADKAAKDALKYDITHFRIPYTDLKFLIKLYVKSLWQIYWDFCDTSKLYSIQNKVDRPSKILLKREEVIITRLRIGHSKLTHSYLLSGELQPECISCDCPLSIYHLLLECCDFTPIRNRLFDNIQSMRDLFNNTNYSVILRYLKECDIYGQL